MLMAYDVVMLSMMCMMMEMMILLVMMLVINVYAGCDVGD